MSTYSIVLDGQRTNDYAPYSWWKTTNVFVDRGDTLMFSATGAINPGFGPSFGPDGQVGNEQNKRWDAALAFRSGGTRCWFGSLIGKIGMSGTAFCIGANKTLAAPATGRLYLAFNDGVSFQDNTGSWNVTITLGQPTPTPGEPETPPPSVPTFPPPQPPVVVIPPTPPGTPVPQSAIDAVAYVIACEAGYFNNDDLESGARKQAIDIAYSMRARINLGTWGNHVLAVVSAGDGTQYNCYRDIVAGRRNPNINILGARDLALALFRRTALPSSPTTPGIARAPYFFAPSRYTGRENAEADAVRKETILANLHVAGICDKDLNQLTAIYAGHSAFNSLGQTTVFFTEFPGCYCRNC